MDTSIKQSLGRIEPATNYSTLVTKLEFYDKYFDKYCESNRVLEQSCGTLKKHVAQQEKQIKKLRTQNSIQKVSIEQSNSELERLRELVKRTSQSNSHSKLGAEAANKKAEREKELKNQLSRKAAQLNSVVEAQKGQIRRLTCALNQKEKQLSKLEAEVAQLQNEVTGLSGLYEERLEQMRLGQREREVQLQDKYERRLIQLQGLIDTQAVQSSAQSHQRLTEVQRIKAEQQSALRLLQQFKESLQMFKLQLSTRCSDPDFFVGQAREQFCQLSDGLQKLLSQAQGLREQKTSLQTELKSTFLRIKQSEHQFKQMGLRFECRQQNHELLAVQLKARLQAEKAESLAQLLAENQLLRQNLQQGEQQRAAQQWRAQQLGRTIEQLRKDLQASKGQSQRVCEIQSSFSKVIDQLTGSQKTIDLLLQCQSALLIALFNAWDQLRLQNLERSRNNYFLNFWTALAAKHLGSRTTKAKRALGRILLAVRFACRCQALFRKRRVLFSSQSKIVRVRKSGPSLSSLAVKGRKVLQSGSAEFILDRLLGEYEQVPREKERIARGWLHRIVFAQPDQQSPQRHARQHGRLFKK